MESFMEVSSKDASSFVPYSIDSIPKELQSYWFLELSDDRPTLSLVCRKWRHLSEDSSLFQKLLKDLHMNYPKEEVENWRLWLKEKWQAFFEEVKHLPTFKEFYKEAISLYGLHSVPLMIDCKEWIDDYLFSLEALCSYVEGVLILFRNGENSPWQTEEYSSLDIHQKLAHLRNWLKNSSQLYHLHVFLKSKNIKLLPEEISLLSGIEKLKLSHNRISEYSSSLCLPGLEDLVLYDNQLKELPVEIGQMSQLTGLNLEKNQLQSLPPELGELTTLDELFLNDNSLRSLPSTISNLSQNLRLLQLGNNPDLEIPQEIFTLTRLYHLDLSGDGLTTLPEGIERLSQLQVLALNNNEIDCFSRIQELPLLSLSLFNNRLTAFPLEITRISTLNTLVLAKNNITSLPEEIGHMSHLRELYLSHNQLVFLPDGLCDLSELRKLHLNKNFISALPESFDLLTNLKSLSMKGNRLSTFPEKVCSLSRIKECNLAKNAIDAIPSSIERLTHLSTFILFGNPLSSISSSIDSLPRLTSLVLEFSQKMLLPQAFDNSKVKIKN